ncbi:MAG TPA: hypothetical protein VE775_04065 [Pyrinomonadaceae bacterium]|nr:hypothetical protein [Pyrinomonadaceae bacterium]
MLPLDGRAAATGVGRRGVSRVRAGNARRVRTRKRHEAAAVVSARTARRRGTPNAQPAHLAPQPEDIPPVKPPKKPLPPADKRNPRQ